MNPFRRIANSLSAIGRSISSSIATALGQPSQKVRYFTEHKEKHTTVLPRWSVGYKGEMPNKYDIKSLYDEATLYRFQHSYLVVVCGETEKEYPTKVGEKDICLSYRIPRENFEEAFRNRLNVSAIDVINDMLPPNRPEEWAHIDQVQIVDKD